MFATVVLALILAAPDFSRQIALSSMEASGQACPVTEHLALTARHMTLDDSGDEIDMFRGSGGGLEGYFALTHSYAASDLAVLRTDLALRPYALAAEAPNAGDHVWLQGYDWRNERDMFQPRIIESVVTRTIAGMLRYVPGGMPGTSGSCVLNENSELVAIDVQRRLADNSKPDNPKFGGSGVAVFGVWKPTLPD